MHQAVLTRWRHAWGVWLVIRGSRVRILCGLLRCGHMPLLPNWFIKGVMVCKTVDGYARLKDPLESIEKSMALSPGSGFLSCHRYVHNSDETSTNPCMKQMLPPPPPEPPPQERHHMSSTILQWPPSCSLYIGDDRSYASSLIILVLFIPSTHYCQRLEVSVLATDYQYRIDEFSNYKGY